MDSLRKSKSDGFVVSASGGADSSAVICLIAIGIALVVLEHQSDAAGEAWSYSFTLQSARVVRWSLRR